MYLTASTKRLINGKIRVSATTAAGRVVWTKDYGLKDECHVGLMRREILHTRQLGLMEDMDPGKVERVVLLQGTTILRGNRVLKKAEGGPKKERFSRAWQSAAHRCKYTLRQWFKGQAWQAWYKKRELEGAFLETRSLAERAALHNGRWRMDNSGCPWSTHSSPWFACSLEPR